MDNSFLNEPVEKTVWMELNKILGIHGSDCAICSICATLPNFMWSEFHDDLPTGKIIFIFYRDMVIFTFFFDDVKLQNKW